ncbi:hypothetical protein TRV_06198, partial [Trichophyton verrucosum HKI 0517]
TPALLALTLALVVSKVVDDAVQLGAQVGADKALLPDDALALPAVPAQRVFGTLGPGYLQHHAHRVREPDGRVRGVGRQEIERALVDGDVLEGRRAGGGVDHLDHDRALVLVEELRRAVDVVVGPGIGPAHHHDRVSLRGLGRRVVDAVVANRRFEKMSVLLQPAHSGRGGERSANRHQTPSGSLGESFSRRTTWGCSMQEATSLYIKYSSIRLCCAVLCCDAV